MKLCSIKIYEESIEKFVNDGKGIDEATAMAYKQLREDCDVSEDLGRLDPADIVELAEARDKRMFSLSEQYEDLETLRDKPTWDPKDIDLVLDAVGDNEETRIRILFPDTRWSEIVEAVREWNRGDSKQFLALLAQYGYIKEEVIADVEKHLASDLDYKTYRSRKWTVEDVKKIVEIWKNGRTEGIMKLFPGLRESELDNAIKQWDIDVKPLAGLLAGYGYISSKKVYGEGIKRSGKSNRYGVFDLRSTFSGYTSGGFGDASRLMEQEEPEEPTEEPVYDLAVTFASGISEEELEGWLSELRGLIGGYYRGDEEEEPMVDVDDETGTAKVSYKVAETFNRDEEVWEKFREWMSSKYLAGYVLEVEKDGESVMDDWFGVEGKEPEEGFEPVDVTVRKIQEIMGIE